MIEATKIYEAVQDCKKAVLNIIPSEYWHDVQVAIDKGFIDVFKELNK